MPDDALPQPWSRPTNLVHYERAYLDVLQRPMTGHVVITPIKIGKSKQVVAVPAKAELVGGVLSVDLLPGSYELVASLMTVEQRRFKESTQITLSAYN